MKRFITMIVAVCAFFAVSAQNPMVTLSHNGELSFFTNLSAFEDAVDAAEDGDTIFLSQGEFIVNGGALNITKCLSIVGNGYGSHILGDITINLNRNNTHVDAPLFDGVRLDKLAFSNHSIDDMKKTSEIRRCWIRTLDSGSNAGRNVTYDKCYIEDAEFYGSGTVLLKNSKVACRHTNSSYIKSTTAINCNLVLSSYYPLAAISCILVKGIGGTSEPTTSSSSASLINTLLDFKPTTTNNVYLNECYYIEDSVDSLFDDKMNCTLNLEEAGYLGEDGKEVGIRGGESPFSENPSVPTVDSANSTVAYDATSNKLKVNITVKAD